jgi:putative membrane protein
MQNAAGSTKTGPTAAEPAPNALAANQTRLAYERTMMAWIRTGTSLISFGFSIYKFADILEGKSAGRALRAPQAYGSAMIVTGLLALVVASLQHRAGLQELRRTGVKVPASLATVVAMAVAILGIAALVLIVFRQ